MIKVLLLILRPIPTWNGIASAKRRWPVVFFGNFLPLLLLASAAEGYGLQHWPRMRGTFPQPMVFSQAQSLVFETTQALLFIGILSLWTKLIMSLGGTFHARHNFDQAFATAAYGLGPLLLLKSLDAIPALSPWLTWAAGIMLAVRVLYYGLPCMMKPDPSHAFGLFLMSTFLMVMITGLGRFFTAWYLMGQFVGLDEWVSKLLAK